MTSEPVPASAEQETRNQEMHPGLRLLQAWKAFAWPVVAALLAAICNFLGYVSESGERAALGIYLLDRASISEAYVINGAIILARLALSVIPTVIAATGLRVFGRRIVRRLPDEIQTRLRTIPKRTAWGWTAVIAAVGTSGFGLVTTSHLSRDADSMILKSAKEVGTAWLRMSIDQDQVWQTGYLLLLAAAITIFVALSWWILTKFFMSTAARAVYSTWAMLELFLLVTGFAYIIGAARTVQPYPIVAFSGMYQLLEKDTAPVLIGSDDKVYAFLLVFKVGPRSETPDLGKAILYLPRTEVKWLTVLRQAPLHAMALYHDLKPPLPVAPTNPEPRPDTPSPGMPARNTPDVPPAKSIPPS